MDKRRHNELLLVSQQIYDAASQLLKEYLERTYAGAGPESMSAQLEDWMFVAEEAAAYLLGNPLAMLEAESQEAEIRTFEENLRKVMAYAAQKQAGDEPPDRLQ